MKKQNVFIGVVLLAGIGWPLADASADKLPDLYTLRFLNEFSPSELQPGDMLNLNWIVANNSTVCIPEVPCIEIFGPAYGPWDEAVFLSKNIEPDPKDILLGTVTFYGVLTPHRAHEVETRFQVPISCPVGDYKLLLYVDYVDGQPSGQIIETHELNNWAGFTGTLRVIPEPATLLLLGLGAVVLKRRIS